MTDSMNKESQAFRGPIRPLNPVTDGPSITPDIQPPADNLADKNTFLAQLGGQKKLRGQAQPGAAPAAPAGMPGRIPGGTPHSGESHRGRNIAVAIGGGVAGAGALIGAWLGLRSADGSSPKNPDSTQPAGAVGTMIPGSETSTLPPGITVTPPAETPSATSIPTETATTTPTEAPAVRGPEYGHASIEQMEGVPAEVKAKLKEILEGADVDIIGNRATVSRDPELADREKCLEAIKDNPKEVPCTSMEELSIDLEEFPDGLAKLDAASAAGIKLIRDADGGELPYIKAIVGGTTTIGNIPLTDQDPNKVIISYHFTAVPDERSMLLPASSTNSSVEVWKIGDWMFIKDDIFAIDGIGSRGNMTQDWKAASLMNDSIASLASTGFKKTDLVYGGAPYALTSGEGKQIASEYSTQLYNYFQPGRTTTSSGADIKSIINVKGKYYYKSNSGQDIIHDNN